MGFNDILKYIQKILCDLERRLKIVESESCECDGGEIDQDNLPLTLYVLFAGDTTLENIANGINTMAPHTIGEKDIVNYIAINFVITGGFDDPNPNQRPPISHRVRIKRKGKGNYGIGGITLDKNDIELLSTAIVSSEEMGFLPNTQTIDLGEIDIVDVEVPFNSMPYTEIGDPEELYIRVLTLVNGMQTDYRFIGPAGFYGVGGNTIALPEYFIPIPNTIVDTTPIPYWQYTNGVLNNIFRPLEIKSDENKTMLYVNSRGTYGRGNAEGNWNLSYGEYALMKITTGTYNTIYGDYAGYEITTGTQNLYMGSFAGWQTQGGSRNTGVGVSSLQENINGTFNTAIGNWSLRNNLSSYNIAIGSFAGAMITTGTNNIIIGSDSVANNADDGTGPTTGSNNTLVGTAKPGIKSGSGNTVLGNPGDIMDAKSYRHVILSDGLGGIAVEKRGIDKPLKSPDQTIALIDIDAKSLITKEYFDANSSTALAQSAYNNSLQAQEVAGEAISLSNQALGTANSAIGVAHQALSSSTSATSTANNALGFAQGASTQSSQAITLADSANVTANNALELADTALTNSNNAFINALDALTIATGANSKGDNALIALGGLSLLPITLTAYNAIVTKDPNTLYIIT